MTSAVFFFGVAVGVLIMVGALVIAVVWGMSPSVPIRPRISLPPATARRAARADLRPAQRRFIAPFDGDFEHEDTAT